MAGPDDDVAEALHSGNYELACKLLAESGADKPNAGPGRQLLLGLTLLLGRRMHECVDVLQRVCARSRQQGEPAYSVVRRMVGPLETIFPSRGTQEINLRLGDYFLRQQEPHEAMPWLSEALTAAPDDPIAIYLEANCRFALYGERQAVRDMEAVLEDAANDRDRAYFIGGRTAAFWFRLGVVYEEMRELERAAQCLTKAAELSDPADAASWNAAASLILGDILVRLGNYDQALAALEAIPRDAENFRYAIRLRAVVLFQKGALDEALALLNEAAEIDPLGAINFLEMGRIRLALGELEAAEIALARAFRTNPELAGLSSAIVELETRLGRHLDADAGLPVVTDFAIPEEFAPRPEDPGLLEKPSFRAACANFWRVMHALIIRDILALYSETGMGYLWALAQPVVFTMTLAAVFIISGHPAPLGTSVIAYLAAGIVPYISFYVRLEQAASAAVRGNLTLLYFRQVTPFTLIAAAFVREYLTSLVAFVVIVGAIAMYDKSIEIRDPLQILMALTCIGLLGSVIGTLLGLGSLAIPSLALAEVVVARVMFFFSGALYYANLLPARMREYALLNPLLHLIEFVRGGLFTFYDPHFANWHYPLEFIGVGIALVVVVLYSTRRYVVAQ